RTLRAQGLTGTGPVPRQRRQRSPAPDPGVRLVAPSTTGPPPEPRWPRRAWPPSVPHAIFVLPTLPRGPLPLAALLVVVHLLSPALGRDVRVEIYVREVRVAGHLRGIRRARAALVGRRHRG